MLAEFLAERLSWSLWVDLIYLIYVVIVSIWYVKRDRDLITASGGDDAEQFVYYIGTLGMVALIPIALTIVDLFV